MKIGIAFDLFDPSLATDGPLDIYEEWDKDVTVNAIRDALLSLGHEAILLGGGRRFLSSVLADPPDLVFNIAEGFGSRSREAHIPAILEFLGIPFTGSDPLTLALTLDKHLAKVVVSSAGVRVPGLVSVDDLAQLEAIQPAFPALLKLRWEGSSIGVRRNSRVSNRQEFLGVGKWLLETYRQPVLVEDFISGPEITVAVVGNGETTRVYGRLMIEHVSLPPSEFVYSLEVKHNWREEIRYTANPALESDILRALDDSALRAFHALGCRDISRIDFRLAPDGTPVFLEVNPLPGLNPTHSDLWIMTDQLRIPYNELIREIVDAAALRLGL